MERALKSINNLRLWLLCLSLILVFQSHITHAQTYPPSSVVTMPFSNAYFKAGTDVEIHVYATDIGKSANNGTVTKVEFFSNGAKLGETSVHTNNTYKYIWGCVPAGEYRITARTTNSSGVTFTSVGVIINVGNNDMPSQGLAACKGKYMAGLHQYELIGNWDPYFNGISAENACKWGSIEGTRGVMNWGGADAAYKAAMDRKIMFRWHAAMWASQYPNWLFQNSVSTADARAELVEFMEGIAQRYPRIDQIDVLNEQLYTHQQANQQMRDKFSGKTNTAIDDFGWQIWLFTEARRIFPNTKLVLNDYGLEGNNQAIDEMLKLVRALRDRGLIDGFGTQAHWFSVDRQPAGRISQDCSRMARGGVPVYVTELDLAGGNDSNNNEQQQLASFQTHFPEFWEHPDVKGITWWGHVLGRTWVTGTGFTLENGQDRAAGAWLKNYMNGRNDVGYPMCPTEGCTNTGQISLAITSPVFGDLFTTEDEIILSATATDGDGTIANLKFYDGTTLLNTDNTSPYTYTWSDATLGEHQIRVVATDNEGNEVEATVTIRVNVPQAPYGGTAHPIPGTIQLEEFDVGGNGSAYMDDTPGSETDVTFRDDEDVDLENCTDTGAGYNLGWTSAGEWLEYTVNVTKPGRYSLDIRSAVNGTDRTVSVTMDGEAIATDIAIPNTTGWQVWQTVTVDDIVLMPGEKVMRLTIGATDYVNLNYVTFTLEEEFIQEPFNSTAHQIPGKIEAEEYDLGGEGLAYHEANMNGNQGNGTFRDDEVDIEVCTDAGGGFNLGYTLTGEWLEYTVNVANTGNYDLDLRLAKDGDGGLFHIEMDEVDITGPIAVPNTGGWQVWETVKLEDLSLTAGEHIMKIVFDTDYTNLNYVTFIDLVTGLSTSEALANAVYPNPFGSNGFHIKSTTAFEYEITDLTGLRVEEGYSSNDQSIGVDLSSGTYILTVRNENGAFNHKIVKQ